MDQQLSAYQFSHIYEDLGYDIGKLGCIMLDIESGDLEKQVVSVIDPAEVYIDEDPDSFATGIAAGDPHVTLLYGLLRSGPEMQKHVLRVLEDSAVVPETIHIDGIGYFDNQRPDKPYFCIVAHVEITPALQACNDRLKFLPHIDTFPGYRAHMTLAYIKRDEAVRDRVVSRLNEAIGGRLLLTKGINFGQ
jgi:hypothetical protein